MKRIDGYCTPPGRAACAVARSRAAAGASDWRLDGKQSSESPKGFRSLPGSGMPTWVSPAPQGNWGNKRTSS
jgi:hypothetical protein